MGVLAEELYASVPNTSTSSMSQAISTSSFAYLGAHPWADALTRSTSAPIQRWVMCVHSFLFSRLLHWGPGIQQNLVHCYAKLNAASAALAVLLATLHVGEGFVGLPCPSPRHTGCRVGMLRRRCAVPGSFMVFFVFVVTSSLV